MENNILLGTIAGDIIGSAYDFNPTKNYDFLLFSDSSETNMKPVMVVCQSISEKKF